MNSSIEPLEARIAPATFLVTSGADSGANTLRQAILGANALGGADTIEIRVASIMPISALPEITDTTFIERGLFSPVINGALAGAGGVDGLIFSGMHTGSSVDNIGIIGFSGDGIVLANGGGNTIEDVSIGGFEVPADQIGGHGIVIQSPSNSVVNSIISGVGGNGIQLEGAGADDNTIVINVVAGNIAGGGIVIGEGSGNLIENNTVGGTGLSGIVLFGSAANGNTVRFNEIGFDDENDSAPTTLSGIFVGSGLNLIEENLILGSGTHGIQIQGGLGGINTVRNNVIQESAMNGILVELNGGAQIQFNQVYYSLGDGVRVTGTARASIFSNLLVENAGLPIDLGGDGPTANDLGTPPDTDTGANDLQNKPVIVEAIALSGSAYVRGELQSTPNSEFSINLVVAGSGEFGLPIIRALGVQTVTTDANGFATFLVPAGAATGSSDGLPGERFLITATNSAGIPATSEATEGQFEVGDELVRILGLQKALWTDVDGDKVTLSVTKGALDYDAFDALPSGDGAVVRSVILDADFNRASVKVTVDKARGGDGRVALGFIDARAINLDTITIEGGLNALLVGRDGTTQSLETLKVVSLGTDDDASSGITIDANVRRILVSGSVVESNIRIGGRVQEVFSVKRDFVDSTLRTDRLTAFIVGGDVRAETTPSGVFAHRTIGTVTVKGDITGSDMVRVSIAAGGVDVPFNDDQATALRSLVVGGDVTSTDILAGFRLAPFLAEPQPVNADVRIGSIGIKGDFTASNVSAGVNAGIDGFFGTADDALIVGGSPDIIARIASIAIGGEVAGAGMATFGFVAQEVGSFRLGRTSLPLTDGLDDLAVDGIATVRVREV